MRWDQSQAPPKVTIIMPSAACAAHVTDCLTQAIQQTSHPNFEIVVIVSQAGPLNAAQENILAPVLASGKVRVQMLEADSFNYSRANNVAASDSMAS